MRKRTAILLAAAVGAAFLSACGGSETSGGSGASGGAVSGKTDGKTAGSGNGEVTWTWGTLRGLYGDAEVTFNEDGGRETVLMKYPGGSLYRQIEYNYDNSYYGNADAAPQGESYLSGKKVYPVEKITKDGNGNPLYNYGYQWAACEMTMEHWGAGVASDITPIWEISEQIEAGQTPAEPEERYYSNYEYGYSYEADESSGYVNYQELSHLTLSGQYTSVYDYGQGYWLTERVDGNPAKTWFYAPDGRLDEDMTITWKYEKGKPVSLQMGQYYMDTYLAEVSDDGKTVTYTLDESHTGEEDAKEGETAAAKDLEQIYTFTLTYEEDGKPSVFQYTYYKEFMNTDEPEKREYTITYSYENGVLSGAEYRVVQNGNDPDLYTITCNDKGMVETEDRLRIGDIHAKAYTYYDSGVMETVTGYEDFTTEDPTQISYVNTYSEDGWLKGEAYYRDGAAYVEYTYFEDGEEAGMTSYKNGNVDTFYTRNENGVYTAYEQYRDDGTICWSGEMTGENEFTMYGYKQDGNNTRYVDTVYTYKENDFDKTVYEDDGSVKYTETYEYHDGKNHQ